MKQQSIIFFDIDGTLYNDDKKIPASTKKAIMSLKELGHEVAIATGRAPFMFDDLREELEIDTFVSYNGQYVVLNGEVIYKNPLPLDAIERLTEAALQHEHPVVYMDHEDMKANVPSHHFIDESISTLRIKKHPTHDPEYYKHRELYQALLFCEEKEEHKYEQQFKEFDFVRWHRFSTDVLPRGGSKAKGIQKVVDALKIKEENVYAFGDGLNDVEMLTVVKNSVAMGNGREEAKEAAKFVTKSVDEDGILHGLKMVQLLS